MNLNGLTGAYSIGQTLPGSHGYQNHLNPLQQASLFPLVTGTNANSNNLFPLSQGAVSGIQGRSLSTQFQSLATVPPPPPAVPASLNQNQTIVQLDFVIIATFSCDESLPSANIELETSQGEQSPQPNEKQPTISSSIKDFYFGLYSIKEKKIIKEQFYDFTKPDTQQSVSKASPLNSLTKEEKKEKVENLNEQVVQAITSIIDIIDKEVIAKQAKVALVLDTTYPFPAPLNRLILESKVATKGYFEYFYSLQKECAEAFALKISEFPTLISILRHFSLREILDQVPTKNSFKQMIKLLSLLLAADHKFTSPPSRNLKLSIQQATPSLRQTSSSILQQSNSKTSQFTPVPGSIVPPRPPETSSQSSFSGQNTGVSGNLYLNSFYPTSISSNIAQASQGGNTQPPLMHSNFVQVPYYHSLVNNSANRKQTLDIGIQPPQPPFVSSISRQISNPPYTLGNDISAAESNQEKDRRGGGGNREIAPFNSQNNSNSQNQPYNSRNRNVSSHYNQNQISNYTSEEAHSSLQDKDKLRRSRSRTNNKKGERRFSKERYDKQNKRRSSSGGGSSSHFVEKKRKNSYESPNRSPSNSLRRNPTDQFCQPNKSSAPLKNQRRQSISQNKKVFQREMGKSRSSQSKNKSRSSRDSSESSQSSRSSKSKSVKEQQIQKRRSPSLSHSKIKVTPKIEKRGMSPQRVVKKETPQRQTESSRSNQRNVGSARNEGNITGEIGVASSNSTFGTQKEKNSIPPHGRNSPQIKEYFWVKLKEIAFQTSRNTILSFIRHFCDSKFQDDNLFMIADKVGRFCGEVFIRIEKERDVKDFLMLDNRDFNGRTIQSEQSTLESFKRRKPFQEKSSRSSSPVSRARQPYSDGPQNSSRMPSQRDNSSHQVREPPSGGDQQQNSGRERGSPSNRDTNPSQQWSSISNKPTIENTNKNPSNSTFVSSVQKTTNSSQFGNQDNLYLSSQINQQYQPNQKFQGYQERDFPTHQQARKESNNQHLTGSGGTKMNMRSRSNSKKSRSSSNSDARLPVDFKSKRSLNQFGILRIRGLPYSCNLKEITEFFKEFELIPDGVKRVYNHQEQKLTGESFIFLKNKDQVRDAKHKLHGQKIFQRYIEVFTSDPTEFLDYHLNKILPQSISSKNNRNRFPCPPTNLVQNSGQNNSYIPRKTYGNAGGSNNNINSRYQGERVPYFDKNYGNNNDSKYRSKRYFDRNSRGNSSEPGY